MTLIFTSCFQSIAYDLDAILPCASDVAFEGVFSACVGVSSIALTSRKWYTTMRSIASEPRKIASEYRSLSEIISDIEGGYCLGRWCLQG